MMKIENFNNLAEGQKITIVAYSEFGGLYSMQTTFGNAEVEPHYYKCPEEKNGVRLIHKPKGKRSMYETNLSYTNSVLIYNNWIDVKQQLEDAQYIQVDENVKKSKYLSFDRKSIKEVLETITQQPIVKVNI